MGDGWNGATLTLDCVDDTTHALTLPNGSSGTESISLVNGCTYSVICANGWYPSEVSWTIVNDNT